jgi:ketosteroid isomerase-like protein
LSQQNLDTVRRWMSVPWAESRAAIEAFWDADADYYPVRKVPEARPCHGQDEVAQFFDEFADAFSRLHTELRWQIPVPGDRVLGCANLRTEGRGSGISLEGDVYYCFWMRHGRFFRVEDHLTLKGALYAFGFEAETLEDAGLSESAMSQNVDLVRSIYAAWERGEFGETDWVDPDIEFQAIGDTPSAGKSTGPQGMASYWREWLSAWEEFAVKAEEYVEVDEERVLVLVRFGGRGKTSGVEIGRIWTRGASVFHIRDGKITRLLVYTDYQRALSDLGLSEERLSGNVE